eukprot:13860020-Alexandrium_andersonii.AAC.1
MQRYRQNGLIRGRSEDPKRGRKAKRNRGDHAAERTEGQPTPGLRLAPAVADPALAAVHAGNV